MINWSLKYLCMREAKLASRTMADNVMAVVTVWCTHRHAPSNESSISWFNQYFLKCLFWELIAVITFIMSRNFAPNIFVFLSIWIFIFYFFCLRYVFSFLEYLQTLGQHYHTNLYPVFLITSVPVVIPCRSSNWMGNNYAIIVASSSLCGLGFEPKVIFEVQCHHDF